MNTNAISNVGASMDAASVYKKDIKSTSQADDPAKKTSFGEEAAAVYEASGESKTENTNLIEQLRADTQTRIDQFRELVIQMFTKQGKVASAGEIWEMLASGDYKVDPTTSQNAAKEISEDGYWGVKQTSERIFDFARALSGDDSEKMDKMLDAFKKGFEEATKAWGKDLPEISKQTYDAVLDKFEQFKNQNA